MSLARTAREVCPGFRTTRVRDSRHHAGFTRKAIGAKFEGETKEADGQTWADIEVEGISSDVSIILLCWDASG